VAISEAEEFIQRFRRRPLWALLALAVVGASVGGGAWLSSFFAEKGKMAAEPTGEADRASKSAPVPAAQVGADKIAVIDGLAVGRSASKIRVDIALRNESDLPVYVTSLEFRGLMPATYVFEHPRDLRTASYEIRDIVAVPSDGQMRILPSPAKGDEARFTYQVHGRFLNQDGEGTVLLAMESAAQIPQRSLSKLSLVMPLVLHGLADGDEQIPLDLRQLQEVSILARMSGGETHTRTLTLELPLPRVSRAVEEAPRGGLQ
jgi:hypothetical protein